MLNVLPEENLKGAGAVFESPSLGLLWRCANVALRDMVRWDLGHGGLVNAG